MPNVRRAVEPNLALSSLRLPGRGVLLAASVALGLFFIILLTLSLAKNSTMAVLLLDYSDNSAFTYPFSIQNLRSGLPKLKRMRTRGEFVIPF